MNKPLSQTLRSISILSSLALILVIFSSFTLNQDACKLSGIFKAKPENIRNEKLSFLKAYSSKEVWIVINGKDCHDCLNFLLQTCKDQNRPIRLIFLSEKPLSTVAKRETITRYSSQQEPGGMISDANTYFLTENQMQYPLRQYPFIVLPESKRDCKIIPYESVWKAMNNEMTLF